MSSGALQHPPMKPSLLLLAKSHAFHFEIRKHRYHPLSVTLNRHHAMRCMPTLKDIQRTCCEMHLLHLVIFAPQQLCDTIIIWIIICAEVPPILEHTAGVGGLQEQGGGECRAVKMPVQALDLRANRNGL